MHTSILARTASTMACWVLISFGGGAAVAQDDGQYQALLVEALEASANGECPESIMSLMLVDVCEQQMPMLAQSLSRLGDIREARYRGLQETESGPTEVYRVIFSKGQMTWMINTGPDGKILVLWSPG